VLMILLLFIHVTMIRLQGITEFRTPEENAKDKPRFFNFFPDHICTEVILALVMMIILSVLATVLPATMGEVANPLATPEVIKPEWFFYVTFRWLKLFSVTFAVLSMGLIVFLMFVWPFIDGWIRKRWPASEFSVWLGIVSVIVIIALTVWEGAVAH